MLSCQNTFAVIGMTVDCCNEDGIASVKQEGATKIVDELLEKFQQHLRGELPEYPPLSGGMRKMTERGFENLRDNRAEAESLINRTVEEEELIERECLADN